MAATVSAYSDANSTLVLETAAEEDEYICVEFTNNSTKDFYGADGIVPIGGKFYLVGRLTAASATETGKKVFKQDYKTIVTFKIKENTIAQPSSDPAVYPDGIGAAYNVIPDLRTPKMELGLSVNLEWQTGLEFVINL
jgi:hypothetical protein